MRPRWTASVGNPRQHTLGEKLLSGYLWHRWVGVVLAVLLLWIAATGVLVNHAHDLGLDRAPVRSLTLLDAWGIPTPASGSAFDTPAGWVIEVGTLVTARGLPLRDGPLVGAAHREDLVLVATPDALLLLAPDGSLVETLAPPARPVSAIGLTADGRFALRTHDTVYVADADLLAWTPRAETFDVATPGAAPADEIARAVRAARGADLNWERVLRDMHALRLPNGMGVWLVDATGAGLALLALSGVWIFVQRRRRDRMHGGHGH
jgi:hypothetical protein